MVRGCWQFESPSPAERGEAGLSMKKADAFFMRTRGGGVKSRVATALFKTRESSNVCCHAKFVYPCPHPNPSLAAQAMLVPVGLEQLAQRERGEGRDKQTSHDNIRLRTTSF